MEKNSTNGLAPAAYGGTNLVVAADQGKAEAAAQNYLRARTAAASISKGVRGTAPSILPVGLDRLTLRRITALLGTRRIIYTLAGQHDSEQQNAFAADVRSLARALNCPMQLAPVIAIDLDSTLLKVNEYLEAEQTFKADMAALGIDPLLADRVRIERYKDLRFRQGIPIGRELLALTYEAAYLELCHLGELRPTEQGLAKCQQIVAQVFASRPKFERGAAAQLVRLAADGYDCHIVTRGDDDAQRQRIQHHPILEQLVQSVTVWSDKTPERYQDFARNVLDLPPSSLTMIGDSVIFDVEAAVMAGYHAIHVLSSDFSLEAFPPTLPAGSYAVVPSFASPALRSSLDTLYGLKLNASHLNDSSLDLPIAA
ncbi:MAG: HAD family hydrolase [Anaerolinea sp.]|nr:HAD family hydrolase [Anaerolinea sp.]